MHSSSLPFITKYQNPEILNELLKPLPSIPIKYNKETLYSQTKKKEVYKNKSMVGQN